MKAAYIKTKEKAENLTEDNQQNSEEYANEMLDQKTEELGSVQSIQDIAKEELGLVDPNTVIIDPE